MKKASLLFVLIGLSYSLNAQKSPLTAFEPFMGKTWKAEGAWGDGSVFKQETSFRYSLDSTVVIAKSLGFTNREQTSYGLRNYGIRQYDSATSTFKFWEFDTFGGLTTGQVVISGKNILYQYQYGGTALTDMWEYVNDSTYVFKVGNYEKGQWKQIFLETQFDEIKDGNFVEQFGRKLKGCWKAKAWDGIQEECWKFNQNGIPVQTAKYSVKGDVQYEASTQMEYVANEIVLFSVIKGNNPKIFKATSRSRTKLVFENSEYDYPNKVVYELQPDGTFWRTISGKQNGQDASYTFKFNKDLE